MIRHTDRFSLITIGMGMMLLAAPSLAQDPPATAPSTEGPAAPSAPDSAPATEPAATPTATPAPDATAMPAPAAGETATQSKGVRSDVEEFWHYGKIARYDLAVAAGQKIVSSGTAPAEVLVAFEDTANDRKDKLDEWLGRWADVPEMKDVTAQITKVLNEGRYTRRADPKFITDSIDRLATSERGYTNGIRNLRDAGELAVPFMVQYLRDPSKQSMQPVIRRAIRDLGRFALNPLVAATEMSDYNTLAIVCTSLGDLGYDVSAPYLARVAQDKDVPDPTKKAASDALARVLGASNSTASAARSGAPISVGNVADMFYQLGEKFYYDSAAISADPRNAMAYVWYWNAQRGLIKIDVPPAIFNELMAMRECESALRLGNAKSDALSLWLASNYKREVELPSGSTDATRAENQPDAHYYGVSAGAKYLNAALTRALADHNAPLALKIILSLQQIAGESNALPGGRGPLVDAMAYPDRTVRFEAAFAVASSLPQNSFQGQTRVVPLLAEALSQTGQPSVLVAAANAEQLNALIQGLKAAGNNAAGATSADNVITAAEGLPSVDVILISDEMPAGEIERLLSSHALSVKLAGAAKLVMIKTEASPYESRKLSDPMISTTMLADPAQLAPVLESARKKAGALPVDPATATTYATRAANLLSQLAISRGQVLDLQPAQPALLSALNDPRPDIVKISGKVLGLLPSKDSQIGLLTVAADEKTADDVKISLYKSLSSSAKFFGNMLDAGQIDTLTKVVSDAKNLEVRSAAAEAHGALNLPADQAKTLIVQQSKN